MPFFPNETLEMYEHSESEELNPYYELESEYKYVGNVKADFQTVSDSDVNLESGEILTDTYRAFIPVNTKITEGMKFKLTGKPHTYTLIGHEVVNNRFTATRHIKLILQIERRPSTLEKED